MFVFAQDWRQPGPKASAWGGLAYTLTRLGSLLCALKAELWTAFAVYSGVEADIVMQSTTPTMRVRSERGSQRRGGSARLGRSSAPLTQTVNEGSARVLKRKLCAES
jgi:hypothetical protein